VFITKSYVVLFIKFQLWPQERAKQMSTSTFCNVTERQISRRTALRAAALVGLPAIAVMTLPGLASANSAAAAVDIEIIDAVAKTTDGRPTGADYVSYESLYANGDNLQAVINKVTGNRILTLPEGEFTFSDFLQGNNDGIRIGTGKSVGCRGLVGSGRNTVIRGAANTASRDLGSKMAGTQLRIDGKANAVLSNFTLKGNPQNGLYYGGITVSNCPDAIVSNLYLRGASRGYANYPPGETFGINIFRSNRATISDCEVDGRDDAGNRVAASPIGWNSATDAKVYRTYCHHGLTGMLTFWDTTNVYTEDYHAFSTSSGAGQLSGTGINHEQSQGTIKHVRPVLQVNGVYSGTADATASTSMHMSIANTKQDVTDFTVVEPTWDKSAGSTGMMTVAIRNGYTMDGGTQKVVTPPRIIKNGVVLLRSDHPVKGWGDKDPNKYFAWVH
jgi:hypothetical protein